MTWAQHKKDQLVRLRRQGLSIRDLASDLGATQGAIKFHLHELPPEIRRSVASDHAESSYRHKRDKLNAQKREKRRLAYEARGRQGPMSPDPDENNNLINEIYNGRKWDSYRFVGQNW